MDAVFFERLWKLIKIAIPGIRSREFLMLGLHSFFLGTWLSAKDVYNGGSVSHCSIGVYCRFGWKNRECHGMYMQIVLDVLKAMVIGSREGKRFFLWFNQMDGCRHSCHLYQQHGTLPCSCALIL